MNDVDLVNLWIWPLTVVAALVIATWAESSIDGDEGGEDAGEQG